MYARPERDLWCAAGFREPTTSDSRRIAACARCTVVPRGTDEGATLELDLAGLQLIANKAVTFRLYSSLTRTGDALGDVVEFAKADIEEGRLHEHAPLHALIRFGKPGQESTVPVKLGARLTEVGTLELWADSKVSDNRWRLQFELRKAAETKEVTRPAAVISEDAVTAAEDLVRQTFRDQTLEPEQLPSRLEQTLALGRQSWPLSAIRRLADQFLEHADGRKKSPGTGTAVAESCGAVSASGLRLSGRRLSRGTGAADLGVGLSVRERGAEPERMVDLLGARGGWVESGAADTEVYQRLAPTVAPAKGTTPRVNSSLLREMWRCACSLELLPTPTRTELGETLLARIRAKDYQASELWCLARLGARELFYGPANQVLPAATAARWVEALAKVPEAGEAIASIARRTGDSARDVAPAVLELGRRVLEKHKDAERLIALLEGRAGRDTESLSRIFGEELPSGLVVAAQ